MEYDKLEIFVRLLLHDSDVETKVQAYAKLFQGTPLTRMLEAFYKCMV